MVSVFGKFVSKLNNGASINDYEFYNEEEEEIGLESTLAKKFENPRKFCDHFCEKENKVL